MKTSRTLKKPILLVLAAILTVAVIASVAVTFAFADGANNATLDGYQVTMNGSIGLRFYYSALGNVTEFKAQVGENAPVSYAIPEGETGARIDVALAPSQMAETVKVWPVYADTTEGTVTEYSVAEYAQYVIANDAKGQANVMRALLNWGNAANEKFASGASKIEDIFARGTNPINAVGNISFTAHDQDTTGDVGGFSGGEANLVLAPEDIQLKFSFKYKGANAANLTAKISRPAVGEIEALDKNVELSIDADGNYFFYVKKVSINLFNALYTLTVNDGTNTYKKQISVLEYLNAISTNTDGAYDAPTKSTAKALYQFYQQGTGSVASCTHNSGKTFYASKDATTDSLKCAVCSATIKDMPKTAGVYVTPEMMNNSVNAGWQNESEGIAYIAEDYKWNASSRFNMADIGIVSGTTAPYFTFKVDSPTYNVSQFIWNRDLAGYGAKTNTGSTYPNEKYVSNVGKAKYFVIKLKVSDDAALNSFNVVFSTVGTSSNFDPEAVKDCNAAIEEGNQAFANKYNNGQYGDPRKTVTLPVASTEWATYVVDLSAACGTAYQPSADGTYDIDTFYFHVGNASGQVFNIEYFAFVEDWATVGAIVDEATTTVTSVISADGKSNAKVNVSSAKCEGTHSYADVEEKHVDGSLTIYDKCVYCSKTISSQTFPASFTKFWTARQYNTTGKSYFFNEGKLNHTVKEEDNMKYTNLTVSFTSAKTSGASQVIFNRNPVDSSGALGSAFSVGQAKYLVVKARANRTDLDARFYVSTSAVDGMTSIRLPFAKANTWQTFVIDLSKGASAYYAMTEGEYMVDTFYTHINSITSADYLDIAYVAFANEDWAEINRFTGEEKVTLVRETNKGVEVNTATGACASGCTISETVNDKKYTHTCSICGYEVSKTISDAVTVYISPQMFKDTASATDAKTDNSGASTIADEKKWIMSTHFAMDNQKIALDGNTPHFTFTRSGSHPNTSILIWNRDYSTNGQHTWPGENYHSNVGEAKYFVIKMRVADVTENFTFWLSTVGANDVSGKQDPGAKRGNVGIPLDKAGNNTWATYVIDLEAVFGDAYQKSADGNYWVDTFYFNVVKADTTPVNDIAYCAFVEGDWTDIDALVDEETAIYITGTTKNFEVNVSNGYCVEEHKVIAETVQNGNYVAACADCGYVKHYYGVTTESANTFLAGNNLKDFGGSVCTYSVTEMNENGESFVRFNNFATTSTTAGWYGVTLQDHNGVGKYMVIKMRIGDNGLNQTAMKMYTSTIDNELKNETQAVTMKISEDGEWYIYVIDLSTRVSACEPDADGVYTSKFLQIRPFTGAQVTVTAYKTNEAGKYVDKDGKELADQSNPANGGVASSYATKPAADDYFDIAYIAYCDDLADVSGITGDEGYLVSTGNNTNVAYNADGTPVEAQ